MKHPLPSTSSRITVLQDLPLFKELPQANLEQIGASAHRRSIRDGEFYFLQGDPAERIFVLAEGRIKLVQNSPDGSQILMRVIEPPALFGVVGLSPGELYPVSAQAAGEGYSLYWSNPEMMGFALEIPQLALNAIQMMSKHVQEFQERYLQLATEKVERRLARAILRLASQSGRKTDEGILINFPLSRQDLAEMTGTTLFTVSRTLSQWESKGLVITGRERVVVRYPHGLVRIAEDLPDLREE